MEKATCSHSRTNDELCNELKQVVSQHPKNFIRVIRSKSYLISYIMQHTSLLVDSSKHVYKLKTRIFWVLNGISSWDNELVQCKICKKPFVGLDVKKLKDGYKKTCCKQCERMLAQQSNEASLERRYGVTNAFNIDSVTTKLQRKKDIIQERRTKTKIIRHTFKASKLEEDAYAYLCKVFGEDDIIRQFKSSEYPFLCDFYIKSQNLYIECNFSWTHGGHWFDESNEDDLKKVAKMKSKCSKYYDNAIETWTMRDVKKRRCAEENNLNYIVFWTMKELVSFFLQFILLFLGHEVNYVCHDK